MDEQVSTIGVILNPVAANGKALELLPKIVSTLQALGRAHHVHVTTAPGDATEVARRFANDGMTTVIAVGGDGTVNEVTNGLLAEDRPVGLGILPAGTGSDFVRSLDVPRDPAEALTRICRGETRRVDVGRATFADGTSRFFVNAGGLGFDAAVAERTIGSRLPGSTIPYLSALIRALFRYRNIQVAVDADGELSTGPACSVIIANGKFLGGGMKLVPTAEVDDGLLDLALIGDISKPNLVWNVPRLYRGTHVNHPKFTHKTVRSVRIETARPARVQLDGELFGTAPVTFSVVPGALLLTQ